MKSIEAPPSSQLLHPPQCQSPLPSGHSSTSPIPSHSHKTLPLEAQTQPPVVSSETPHMDTPTTDSQHPIYLYEIINSYGAMLIHDLLRGDTELLNQLQLGLEHHKVCIVNFSHNIVF